MDVIIGDKTQGDKGNQEGINEGNKERRDNKGGQRA